jgi:enoyl-CoA hydratase/carnithine racemase
VSGDDAEALVAASDELAADDAVRGALLGQNLTDDDARDAGLVHEVLPADGFEAACLSRLEEMAAQEKIRQTVAALAKKG